jgi:hypothetical protein
LQEKAGNPAKTEKQKALEEKRDAELREQAERATP